MCVGTKERSVCVCVCVSIRLNAALVKKEKYLEKKAFRAAYFFVASAVTQNDIMQKMSSYDKRKKHLSHTVITGFATSIHLYISPTFQFTTQFYET